MSEPGDKAKTERIRDPIHDMIVFRSEEPLDMTAWSLLETPDVQRLRRIKQLGVSEFVYPSAAHTRFAHSVGVFQNARRLVRIIEREIKLKRVDGDFDPHRADVAVLAALLHDIGHGPFSHAFEEARKSIAEERGDGSARAKIRKHEAFTAEMVEDPKGAIAPILAAAKVEAKEVADLIRAETPTDMYHAIVSSSFDADRLDYLERDRYMTGVGAGAIDIEWLMDNVRVADIDVAPADAGKDAIFRHSFCLLYKARDAAEDFLLARYRLYTNVYFHKTTRGIEQLVGALFREVARLASAGAKISGINPENPLIRFFANDGETLENYRLLDDVLVWGAIHSLALTGDGICRDLAARILNRKRPACVDVQVVFPSDIERQRRLKHRLDELFRAEFGKTVFRDSAKLSLYGAIGADDNRAQKRLMIQFANGDLKEITDFVDATIAASDRERPFDRYYFLDDSDCRKALSAVEALGGRRP
jgi:HD superfamily phosphohydrolase